MSKRKDKAWFALFTVPLLFIFTTVVLIPFIIGIVYSFVNWDGIPANPKVFVGFDNYVQLFQDERFLSSAWHTVQFTLLALVCVNILGLAFALLVTTKLRSRNAARTMFFMPNLIGGLILGYIWQFILRMPSASWARRPDLTACSLTGCCIHSLRCMPSSPYSPGSWRVIR